MKLIDITNILEREFPREAAYEWDNPGLLVGDKNRDIKKVLLTLDVTEEIVIQAAECGADLILSHHPIMLKPIRQITAETAEGRLILKAAENRINIYAAHTNCDVAKNGINARLAEIFELTDAEPVEENGLGRIGSLKKAMSLGEFAYLTAQKLHTPHVRVVGDTKSAVRKVAVGSGACSDIIPAAIAKGADALVTGDTKYHEMLNAEAAGISVIDAGHYPTEIIVEDVFAELLKDCDIELMRANSEDIFKYI